MNSDEIPQQRKGIDEELRELLGSPAVARSDRTDGRPAPRDTGIVPAIRCARDVELKSAMLRILPSLDNFLIATTHRGRWADGQLVDGYEQAFEHLMAALKDLGLERIEAVGTPFDCTVHKAVAVKKSDEPADMVIEEMRAGFKFRDCLLRPSEVVVSARPNAEQ